MSSIGRPLMPPDLLMRSTAICVPTSAVLPPAAAAPESGCSEPILYGLAWPKAACHGAGTSMVAPSAPAAAEVYPIRRRRVTLPRYQNSSVQSFALSVIVCSSQVGLLWRRQVPCQLPVSAAAAPPAHPLPTALEDTFSHGPPQPRARGPSRHIGAAPRSGRGAPGSPLVNGAPLPV